MASIKVGIVGGTGYTGAELLRLLLPHPCVEVRLLTSRQEVGRRADLQFPQLQGRCALLYSLPEIDALSACDAVFFATPHGAAMGLAPELIARGVRVIDLSADFRLRDPAVFARWYHLKHQATELLHQAVYGLPEVNREAIRQARLIACPGCFPTAVQLGFIPLLEAGIIKPSGLIADCKSGVSGAGRDVRLASLYCEVAESFKAYGVAGHRHLPEIEQGLALAASAPVGLTFVPHLVPMNRGIHATLYAELKDPAADVQSLFETRYAGEAFVQVLAEGDMPDTRSVRATNLCRIAIHRLPGDRLVILSVIDNLVKGAAGQALQCLNLMFGLDETTGLDLPALSP